ncbi:type I methionyl aminopeptidase [Nocardia sp. NPDC059240]|uniref:type I methionyl aminopeptidase n=1 Tax=Nocardia sp. NPDC059240 TaxID=3346786 RepID=UPI0036C97C15
MLFWRREKVVAVRSFGELEAMAATGAVVDEALGAVWAAAGVGVSTLELAGVAEGVIREAGAVPTFKGYYGFPGAICVSVNDHAVNGVPAAERVLAEGDLVSVNCGAILDGWHSKAACTFGIGALAQADEELIEATRISLEAGAAAMLPGNRVSDVSDAIEMGTRSAEQKHGRTYGILEDYGGHGIGREMHMQPFVPNEGGQGKGPRLKVGSVLALQPILTLGTTEIRVLDDEFTGATLDRSRSALWQSTIVVTEDGPRILTPGWQ